MLAFWAWSAWPLLMWTDERAFAGRLTTDNVVSAWFYDYVSQSLWRGWDFQTLQQLNHPRPHPTWVEFPAVMDAVLAAPLGWLLGWPRQWGATHALALLVNGLGGALVARSLGARGLGTAVAGCLAILCRPVWKDLVMARMNAVWPGVGLLSVGALCQMLRAPKALAAVAWAVLAAATGALAATITRRGCCRRRSAPRWCLCGLGRAGMALAAAWPRGGPAAAWPELARILGTRSGQAGWVSWAARIGGPP